MKIAIILILLGLATSATVTVATCSCSTALNAIDCPSLMGGKCFWTGTACRTATCADISGTPSLQNCNQYGCVFKGTACVAFTQCSDYTVTDATQCASYYYSGTTTCVAGTLASGSYPCVNAPVTAAPNCSSASNNGTCKNLSNSASNCGWNGTACVAYTPTKCTICGGSPCAEVAVSTLTAANCASTTYGGSTWTASGACVACRAFILFATFILALLF